MQEAEIHLRNVASHLRSVRVVCCAPWITRRGHLDSHGA